MKNKAINIFFITKRVGNKSIFIFQSQILNRVSLNCYLNLFNIVPYKLKSIFLCYFIPNISQGTSHLFVLGSGKILNISYYNPIMGYPAIFVN